MTDRPSIVTTGLEEIVEFEKRRTIFPVNTALARLASAIEDSVDTNGTVNAASTSSSSADEEVLEEVVESVFRLNNSMLFLTYSRCEIPKKELRKLICGCVGPAFKFLEYVCASEKHKDDMGHRHVLIRFNKAFQTRSCRRFDVTWKGSVYHPNIRKVRNSLEWAKALTYISKEDTAVKKVADGAVNASQIWQCESLSQALVLGGLGNMKAMEIKAIYDAKPRGFVDEEEPLPDFGWYSFVQDAMEDDDYRKVNWFCDRIGNCGKSAFSRHAFISKSAWVIKKIGKSGDFECAIVNAIDSGWDGKCLIIDIPRRVRDFEGIYEAIEVIKDGLLTNTKYQSGTFLLPPKCVVIVFANWWPQVDKMSLDRWRLFRLLSRDEVTEVDCRECRHLRIRDKEEDDSKEWEAHGDYHQGDCETI